jgi:hypothetical protein
MEHSDMVILSTSLRLLQYLFEGTQPKQRTISTFLAQFWPVVARADIDGQCECLNALAVLMDSTLVFKEVAALKHFPESFSPVLESEELIVQVSALRICFAFCSNPITAEGFMSLIPVLVNLLKATIYPAIIAAYSTAALLARADPVVALGEYALQLKAFLSGSLALESELTAPAVRLVGVLASSMKGADLLEQWEVMPHVAELMNSPNEELRKLSLMAITAMSAAVPDSAIMFQSIPTLFEAAKDEFYEMYPLICLSNITVDPLNAAACVSYLTELFVHFQSAVRAWAQRAIVTVYRILLAPEAHEVMIKEELLEGLFEVMEPLWEGEHAPILFDIVETLTRETEATKWMKDHGMLQRVKAKLLSCELNDTNRPKFIRIRTRLLSVK